MAVLAALYREVRQERHSVALDGTLRGPERRPYDVVVEDLSRSGFRVPAVADLELDDPISLGLAGVGLCPARVVRRTEQGYGCAFLAPLTIKQLDAALVAEAASPIQFNAGKPRPSETPCAERAADPKLDLAVRMRIILVMVMATWAVVIQAVASIAW